MSKKLGEKFKNNVKSQHCWKAQILYDRRKKFQPCSEFRLMRLLLSNTEWQIAQHKIRKKKLQREIIVWPWNFVEITGINAL